jgi:alpha-L-fucosidase
MRYLTVKRLSCLLILLVALTSGLRSLAAPAPSPSLTNRADRLEWFRDQGFGLFIHWNLDSQIGSVISHSMVGASEDYLKRYVEELPRTFNPRKFHPQDWAALAKLAGVRYVVFTAKHHSGFCMWPTKTTDFDIKHTPFKCDITGELLRAFKKQGVAPGLYFSPDDFWWLYKNHKTLQRNIPDVQPENNPGLMAHDLAQVRELLTRYGPIDVLFFDGQAQGLRDLAWQLQPNAVVTRGAMNTPEQFIPGQANDQPWEANFTMGKAWGYQPTLEDYKDGGKVIAMLIETRAKGGNLLLNLGPKPDGELPIEQEERLREVALWMFVNGEAIHAVRPWILTNEKDIWFTKRKDTDTVYAFVKEKEPWKVGEWKDIVLQSIKATGPTEVSILGQNDKVLEYKPTVTPRTTWKQEPDGLHIRAMRAQRLDDLRQWPNPVVLKITHAQPARLPPRIETVRANWDAPARLARCVGALHSLGGADAVEVGFQYRDITGLDIHERRDTWQTMPLVRRAAPGEYSAEVADLQLGRTYEFRSLARNSLLTIYGAEIVLKTQ